MTAQNSPAPAAKSGRPRAVNKAITVVIGIVVVIIAYFILASFIPRWWAQRIGSLANSTFSGGILWGLVFGALCTFIPLLLIWFAVTVWRKRSGKLFAIASLIVALVVAVPNLMTLTIVFGTNSAAHAGERILDVDGPGFRGASALGAIVAVVLFAAIVFLLTRRRRRRSALRTSRAAQTPSA